MKKAFAVLLSVIFIFLLTIAVSAENITVSDVLEQSGANRLEHKETGLTPYNFTEKITFSSVVDYIFSLLKKVFKEEIAFISLVAGVIIASLLFDSFKNGFLNSSSEGAVNAAIMTVIMLILSSDVTALMQTADNAVKTLGDFAKILAPVGAALMVSSGQTAASVTAEGFLFAGAELMVYLSANFVLPAVYLYFALCVANALCPNLKLSGVTALFKKTIIAVLVLLFGIFTAVMSIQTTISITGDNVAKSGIKALVSSVIPYLGTASAETVETFLGCANLAKTTVGGFGTAVIFAISLLPMLSVLVKYAVLRLAGALSEMGGNVRVSNCLKDVSGAFSMILTLTFGSSAALSVCLCLSLVAFKG